MSTNAKQDDFRAKLGLRGWGIELVKRVQYMPYA